MDLQYNQENSYKWDCGWQLDIAHFDRKYLDTDLYIFYSHMLYPVDTLNWQRIQACIMVVYLCNLLCMNKQHGRLFLYIDCEDHTVMGYKGSLVYHVWL